MKEFNNKQERNELIRKEFAKNLQIEEIAKEVGLSTRRVREIVEEITSNIETSRLSPNGGYSILI